jgi:predicted aminopeptidase
MMHHRMQSRIAEPRASPHARALRPVHDPLDGHFSNWCTCFRLDALSACCSQYRRAAVHWHTALPSVIPDAPYA